MSLDDYKLATPPIGEPLPLDAKCICGKPKFIANNFCDECKEKRKLKTTK